MYSLLISGVPANVPVCGVNNENQYKGVHFMKIKKTLVTLLLVIVLALTMTLFVACDEKDSDDNDSSTVGFSAVTDIIDNLLGYALTSGAYVRVTFVSPYSTSFEQMKEASDGGMIKMAAIINKIEDKNCGLYFYDSSEKATDSYNRLKAIQEDFDYELCIKDSNIVAYGNALDLYEEVKNSTIPNDVLTEKQLTFIRNSINAQLSKFSNLDDESWDMFHIILSKDESIWTFASHIIYRNNTYFASSFEFTTDLSEREINSYNQWKNEIGTTYTTNSYVNIEEDGIYAYLEQLADEE